MYYIEKDNKIVLADEKLEVIKDTLEFTPQYKGCKILETKENEVIIDFKLMTLEEAQQEEAKAEAERIANLKLTAADVERGIYKARDLDFDDIVAMVIDKHIPGIDIKGLKIELKANHFYRGNPYVNQIGQILDISEDALNKFFEYNDYRYLLPEKPQEEPHEDTTEPVKQ